MKRARKYYGKIKFPWDFYILKGDAVIYRGKPTMKCCLYGGLFRNVHDSWTSIELSRNFGKISLYHNSILQNIKYG